MAQEGVSVAIRSRGHHNFKMLARDNPKIAHSMSGAFKYEAALKEVTPELGQPRRARPIVG